MLKSQSTELFVSPEELQRITFFATQNQRNSHKSNIPAAKQEEYTFKPQVRNNGTINRRSTRNQPPSKEQLMISQDGMKGNHKDCNSAMMILQMCIPIKQTQELQQNANRLTHEVDTNQPSVFERLYVVRKSNETIQQTTKRNTSDSHPYFTKNMSNTLYSEYKKQISGSPEQQESEYQQVQEQEVPTPQKACLPNRFYFDQSEQQQNTEPEPKVTIPQHMFVDFRQQIKQINEEPEPVPSKKPLNRKEIDLMVERMNNWLQKRNYKVQEQWDRQIQNESNECTFYPKLSCVKQPKAQQSIQNSQRVSQQSSYSNLFKSKNN
ncbi:unnamed protein product (macronuclear) [Paramecium tetraurelia]|uniref:Uncharacterized protein n=1 Tax=Paramecium tetraurelia TaxID=5888 RepID=A0C634_PARTE|nr:uncharacterized protein GSPATT00035380001 [Paramecium tetraurelia]CAK66251.1 unnamed protein product [Paramecium tetraurelia]|eukprot:XP_001433648.1 hypothetical protein (macronuclear) [Paramecium tetraurelia strain d4-2]